MKALFLITLLYGLMATPSKNTPRSLNKNGMKVEWKTEQERIEFSISAPCNGWVALGFNNEQNLVGSTLIMACVENGQAELAEHYVLAPGDYKPIADLGGIANTRLISIQEKDGITKASFSVSCKSASKYHVDLKRLSRIWLTMAYSQSDEFQHHSTMRTACWISL